MSRKILSNKLEKAYSNRKARCSKPYNQKDAKQMQILQYKDHFIVKLNNSELVAPTVSNVINITQDSKIYNEIQLVVLNSKLV